MSIGFWQIVIIAIIIVLLFGRGKISDLMGDVAKGIKSFKTGLQEDDDTTSTTQSRTIEHNDPASVEPAEKKNKVG
ncbi:sec-independent protein translocase protein TatA [Rhodopseudomonas julia]|uniref:Sec-independent protein translocase protein TatA n=1 Tax=Rhodopseudomonas julia TaxID=200617 RepID=A0ABU0CAX1_9BRAD|nr:twin-arginine translocase TatA/TatE family subunit [Rhodopseudomonas julia]MDQ0327066.1 sec-independent protein translocase protein TatA [Rhodopseudomonas julia]